ncbi:MAG: lysophospholipid acyltransferase family protein [Leptolyngbyaceae cyanobacterium MO_188.B28]|nr:lysophospholipid acyltransferase family protein [Leptolyngbyaceae cyanobacterium MO_188.B28]
MFFPCSLHLSHWLLTSLETQTSVCYRERVPLTRNVLVVSNHRSFLDAPLLMAVLNRPVRFACHHYMSQVPILREMVTAFGAFPLDAPNQRQKTFFHQATDLMRTRQAVGIFPEGAQPMVQARQPNEIRKFHRGFAHLALRAPVQKLAILPVAIASTDETRHPVAPLKLLSLFDPSEPLFDKWDWHPAIIYHRVNLLFGRPIWITDVQRQQYQGKQGGKLAKELTLDCAGEIADLLRQGCY